MDAAADLDLRVVRYFVCIAELEGFGRAAAELRIGQPSLSRQIRALEKQLGQRLFDRTPAGARLTAAGAAFLPRARGLLRAARDAVAAIAGEPEAMTIGYSPGIDVAAAVRELRARQPDADVRTVHLGWRRPAEVLLAGEVDAVVVRLPLPADGLTITELYDEPRVVAIHRDHPLATRESVTVDDVAELPMPGVRIDDASSDFWRLEPRADGRPAPTGPAMASLDDAWQMIAQGDIVAVVTVSHARAAAPGTALVPLRDAPPSRVVLAVRADDRSPLVAAFRDSARVVLPC